MPLHNQGRGLRLTTSCVAGAAVASRFISMKHAQQHKDQLIEQSRATRREAYQNLHDRGCSSHVGLAHAVDE